MQARRRRPLALPEVVLLRLSLLLGVATALRVLLNSDRDVVRWLRRRNRLLVRGGRAPIAVITAASLDDVARLRRSLEALAAGCVIGDDRIDASVPMLNRADIVFPHERVAAPAPGHLPS